MKRSLFVAVVLMLGIMAGCQNLTKVVATETFEPESVQTEAYREPETETVMQTKDAEGKEEESRKEQEESAQETEALEPSETQTMSEEDREAAFKSLKIEVSEGTVSISTGAAFSLTRRSGKDVDYEISGDVLHVRAKRSDEVVLVLPENDSYEALELVVKNGHAYVDGTVTADTLLLEAEHGEVSFNGVVILEDSTFSVNGGSVSFHGDPGVSVNADCRQGHLELAVPFEEAECSYEIAVSGGNVSLGGHDYHGKSGTYTLQNDGGRLMQLSCTHGAVSVDFGKH